MEVQKRIAHEREAWQQTGHENKTDAFNLLCTCEEYICNKAHMYHVHSGLSAVRLYTHLRAEQRYRIARVRT
jgi:hypothetical protein